MMHRERVNRFCVCARAAAGHSPICVYFAAAPRAKSTHLSNLHQNFSLYSPASAIFSPPLRSQFFDSRSASSWRDFNGWFAHFLIAPLV